MIVKDQSSSPEENNNRINLTAENPMPYRQGIMLRDDDEDLESDNEGAIELSDVDIEMGARIKGRRHTNGSYRAGHERFHSI